MGVWRDRVLWVSVAQEIRQFRTEGLGHVLTEETVRFATVKALVRHGVPPEQLWYEVPHAGIPRSRVDLVVGTPVRALIELKYPREPNLKNTAWTTVYGEVLKDFYRLAAHPGEADRIFVYVESARLASYMARAATKYGLNIGQDTIVLHPTHAGGVPKTMADILGPDLPQREVRAARIAAITIDASLSLHVYTVEPVDSAPTPDGDAGTRSLDLPATVSRSGRRAPREVRAPVGPLLGSPITSLADHRRTSSAASTPTWRLVLNAARDLHTRIGEFSLDQLVRHVQAEDPGRGRVTIQPTVQGMTVNAGTGPASPCGKPLRRVRHGYYILDQR